METNNHAEWSARFEAWRTYAERIQGIADRVDKMKRERAYRLAATVGLPAHAGMIHNATCDTALQGWCANNPERLRVAKRCKHILSDWRAGELARTLVARHYPR